MGRYKISDLTRIWSCSVPTARKRVADWQRDNKCVVERGLSEQNKMIDFVVVEEQLVNEYVVNIENGVNDNVANIYNDDVIDVEPVSENSANKFVEAIMILTHEHEKIIDRKNEELAKYQASALLLEDKKYTEGLLIDDNKELKQKNRELEREQKNLQKVNDYLKYAIFASIVIIVGLLVFFIR